MENNLTRLDGDRIEGVDDLTCASPTKGKPHNCSGEGELVAQKEPAYYVHLLNEDDESVEGGKNYSMGTIESYVAQGFNRFLSLKRTRREGALLMIEYGGEDYENEKISKKRKKESSNVAEGDLEIANTMADEAGLIMPQPHP